MKLKTKLSRYTLSAIAIWALCAVLTAAGYGLFYAPKNAEVTRLKSQYGQIQDELDHAQAAAQPDTRMTLQQQFEEKEQLIGCFSTEQNAETELVFEIGQIASELGLREFSSKQEDQQTHPTVKDGLEEEWLSVEFYSTFEQFAQFINRLERNCPVVFVEKVFLRRSKEGVDGKGHDVSLMLSFLIEKEKKPIAVAKVSK